MILSRNWLSCVLVICFLLSGLTIGFAASPHPVVAAAAVADGFDFPLDPTDGTSGRPPDYASYDAQNPYLLLKWSKCYQKSISKLQHSGEDWFRSAGSPVYAVANGHVVYAQYANYPGYVVVIEHTLPDGVQTPWGNNVIYSMYAHLDSTSLINEGADVVVGQQIGQILDQG